MASLLYEVKDGIAWIRFNKPEILNAFDADECRYFVKTLKEAAEDKAVKAIILSSVGPAFSAGRQFAHALGGRPVPGSLTCGGSRIHPTALTP